MSYTKEDMLHAPQPVRVGLMSRSEWSDLESLAETDVVAWKETMIRLSERSNLLFNHFFIPKRDIPPFMVEVEHAIQEAERRYQPVNTCLPRGHIKSTTRIIGDSLRRICLSAVDWLPQYADPRILLIQESKPVAIKTTLAIKTELENNRAILSVFGDLRRKSIAWEKDTIWIRNDGVGASKEPTYMGTGLLAGQTGFHPYYIKGDDVTTYESGRTKGRREHGVGWYDTTIKPAKEPQTNEEWAYTPYFDGELTHGFEKDKKRLWIRRPALNRMVKQSDYELIQDREGNLTGISITPDGMDLEALWPCPLGTGNCPNTAEHYAQYGLHRSVEWLIFEQYLSNPFRFQTQYMLNRVSDLDTRIKPDMLRFWTRSKTNAGRLSKYNDEEAKYIEYPEGLREITARAAHGWDTAIGKTKAHDRSAGALGYRTKTNDLVVLFHKGRWDPVRLLDIMQTDAANDPVRNPGPPVVENANFEKVIAAFSTTGKNAGIPLKIVQRDKPNSDKDVALSESGLLAHMMAGKVFIEFEDDDAIEELLSFRQDMGHEHDDCVDALRIVYEELFKRDKKVKMGFV